MILQKERSPSQREDLESYVKSLECREKLVRCTEAYAIEQTKKVRSMEIRIKMLMSEILTLGNHNEKLNKRIEEMQTQCDEMQSHCDEINSCRNENQELLQKYELFAYEQSKRIKYLETSDWVTKNEELENLNKELTTHVNGLVYRNMCQKKNHRKKRRGVEHLDYDRDMEIRNAEMAIRISDLESRILKLDSLNDELTTRNKDLESRNEFLESRNEFLVSSNEFLESRDK